MNTGSWATIGVFAGASTYILRGQAYGQGLQNSAVLAACVMAATPGWEMRLSAEIA